MPKLHEMHPSLKFSVNSFRCRCRTVLLIVAMTGSGVTHLAAQSPAVPIPLVVTGEVRTRSEWDSPGGGLHSDMFTYLRARFGVRADISPTTHLVVQGQDSRVFGAESNTTATNPDIFDLHQGYLELGTTVKKLRGVARVGRQEIVMGNERIVGAANWTNTGRSFDALRITVTPATAKAGAESWSATAFAATVDEHGRHFASTGTTVADNSDHAVIGMFIARPGKLASIDVTALYDDDGKYRKFEHANRSTFDVHARTDSRRFLSLELEGAFQVGHQQIAKTTNVAAIPQQIHAWLGSARLVRAALPTRKISAIIGVDALSGDSDPANGTYSTFNTMYATNHGYYGLLDLLPDPTGTATDRGFTDVFATLTAALNSRASGRFELHQFAAQAGDRRPMGVEGDVVIPVKLSAYSSFDAGYAVFRAADGALAAGLGAKDTFKQWMFLQVRVGF